MTNLAGAIWADLVPTVIALAIYFCIADTILILQCLYYNLWVNRTDDRDDERKHNRALSASSASAAATAPVANGHATHPAPEEEEEEAVDENEPILSRQSSHPPRPSNLTAIGLPGSHTRRSTDGSTLSRPKRDGLGPTGLDDSALPKPRSATRAAIMNTAAVVAICAVGTAGWAVAWRVGAWRPATPPASSTFPSSHTTAARTEAPTPLGATLLGYTSAACYLLARLPQILQNYRQKSTQGLSLLFFLLSLLGNLTYGAGILAHSLERAYVVKNVPWLLGSLGTVVEDLVIGLQFRLYGAKEEEGEGDVAVS